MAAADLKTKAKFFKDSAFGWDGLTTFILSNVLLILTFFLGFFFLFFQVLKMAISAKTNPWSKASHIAGARNKCIFIAGLCLENNQPVEAFKTRLRRAIALEKSFPMEARELLQFIILGGVTGNSQISEACAGADFLRQQGLKTANLLLEDQSRHTLENMQNARILLLQQKQKYSASGNTKEELAIISSRYHLYRILTFARGLQMNVQPIAAEEHFTLSFLLFIRLLKEAYYLHWYWSGKLWLFLTDNKRLSK